MIDLKELDEVLIGERIYTVFEKILRSDSIVGSTSQNQTKEVFGFKWKKEDTFNSDNNLARMKKWLIEKYGQPEKWLSLVSENIPIVLDAGCGAGMSGFEYWGDFFEKILYVGIDISEAIDVAHKRFHDKGLSKGIFIQETITNLPFTEPSFDIIFCEGVLHHTDNTRESFSHLCQFLKPGGLFMFYIYRKKSLIREFTDDVIRKKLQSITLEEMWEELKSLTQFGIELGKLDVDINVPNAIKSLDIPAGKFNLQRFFYWNIFKIFYDPNLSFDEMNHINFDWYAPKNAHRHTIEEVREWCQENGLAIQQEKEELAGLTFVAKKV